MTHTPEHSSDGVELSETKHTRTLRVALDNPVSSTRIAAELENLGDRWPWLLTDAEVEEEPPLLVLTFTEQRYPQQASAT